MGNQTKNGLENNFFRNLSEKMNAAVFEWNFVENSFYCSDSYKDFAVSKVNSDDILNNKGPLDIVYHEDLDKLLEFFEKSKTGQNKVEVSLRLKMIDNSFRWCRMIGFFFYDKDGKPTHTIGVIIDVNSERNENISLNNLLDEVPVGIGIYDLIDGNLVLNYLNKAYYKLLGFVREDRKAFFGSNTINAIYEQDRSKVLNCLSLIEKGKENADILVRVQNKKNNFIWMKFSISVFERKENYVRLYVAITDCDELIRTKEELINQYDNKQVRYQIEDTGSLIASSMVNLTANTISLQNTKDSGILGIISKKTPQEGFESMYETIPDLEIREQYKNIFDTKKIIENYKRGITHNSIRHPYLSFNVWYDSGYEALKNPKTGDFEVYCYAKDVTKETVLNDVNNIVLNHSYDEVILINPKTGEPFVLIDNGKSKVYEEQNKLKNFENGYEKGVENYFINYSADEDPQHIAKNANLSAVVKALETQEVYTINYSIKNKENNVVHRRASYYYLNKYKSFILCAVQDITNALNKELSQKKRLQEALETSKKAGKAKAEFYSRMSHDMRTPMNGILGMAYLSENESDINVLRENIKKIKESGQYLLSLINDTLDIQRIESGKMKIDIQVVNTQNLIDGIISIIKPEAERKGVNFIFSNQNIELNTYFKTDLLHIKQIFINLLSNAVKFTPVDGTVKFDIKLSKVEGKTYHVVIKVIDNGIGMSKEFLQNGIFMPFRQESNEVSSLYAGSGLGLSIAKSLVELLGGKIEVQSELGEGTTFTIFFDFESVEEKDALAALKNKKVLIKNISKSISGTKILLAEDNLINAEISNKLLKNVGCEVTTVYNGLEAVSAFSDSAPETFDLILMDIRMPVMDGLEATKKIRSLARPDAAVIPIIAMTANAYDNDANEAISVGMNAHLGKPVEPETMYSTIAQFVKVKK